MPSISARDYKSRSPQYGDAKRRAMEALPPELRVYTGPIPRHYYGALDDDEIASEIKRRYIVRKTQMSERIALDMRLLRWYDPEVLQDHWQSLWTGKPHPKMFHTSGLSVNIYNYTKPVLEAGVGLLAGGKPRPYDINVKPLDEMSESSRVQADIIEQYVYRMRRKTRYDVTYTKLVTDLWFLGRCWRQVTTDDRSRLPRIKRLWPGSVAGFFADDGITLEQAIVATHMLPSDLINMYPEHKERIIAATMSGEAAATWQGIESRTKHKFDKATVLTSWYRTGEEKVGMCVVLMGAAPDGKGQHEADSFLLAKNEDTGYRDIPVRCTPRFAPVDKDLDEAQGILFEIAGPQSEFNEVMSAFHDSIWRAVYQRYKAKGFVKPPKLLKGTNIYAMRSDQDILRLDDVLNDIPIEHFIDHLEEMILLFGRMNQYMLGKGPPGETSGEAIVQSINASLTNIEPTRTWLQGDEEWTHEQFVQQGVAFGEVRYDDRVIPMSEILGGGDNEIELGWLDVTPRDAVKAKQLALAGFKAGVIDLDRTQDEWRILSKTDMQRRIRRERRDPIMRPESVSATAAAIIQMARAKQAEAQTQALLQQTAGPPPGAQLPSNTETVANEMATTAAARGAAPNFESDNAPTGGPPATAGSYSNPSAPA